MEDLEGEKRNQDNEIEERQEEKSNLEKTVEIESNVKLEEDKKE